MRIKFLGTGASGQIYGVGKSKRLESSLYIQNRSSILIDVTHNFNQQVTTIENIDCVLLTHAHKDAIGGLPQLERWLRTKNSVNIFCHPKTIETIKRNYKRLKKFRFFEINNGEQRVIGDFRICAIEVPHALSENFPTFAWKIEDKLKKTIVYASDIGLITTSFSRFCQNIDLLILDGAMWEKKIFSHIRIDQELKEICTWDIKKILLTHIGKTAPPHETLRRRLKFICRKAFPAFDGMKVEL